MKNKGKKCLFKDHKEIEAIIYCKECKVYMCKDCTDYHKGLFEKHTLLNINDNIPELFNCICKIKNHSQKLEYFCKTHNQLCCAACITKIKNTINGQHTDCNICLIQEIKKEKKNQLKENIQYLEDLSETLKQSINDIKKFYDKLKKNQGILRQQISYVFNRIRHSIDNRENEILCEADKQFNNLFIEEDIINGNENLIKNIKISIEMGKNINNEWNNNNKLISLINDCINIEKNIKSFKVINDNLKKCNFNKHIKLNFIYDDINIILDSIKLFGRIDYNNFKFKQCPLNIKDNRKYVINGENGNILTKIGKNNYAGTICESELDKTKNHKWKIKILNAKYNQVMVGVAPIDFDINSSNQHTCGWYLNCYNSTLYSGPPHNYNGKRTNLRKVNDEIVVVMNMENKTLKFILYNQDRGEQYTDIPIDKPLFPAVLLYNKNSSVEIMEC